MHRCSASTDKSVSEASSGASRVVHIGPRAGDDIALVHNPRTGEPFSVPALILPDERDLALVCRLTGDSTR